MRTSSNPAFRNLPGGQGGGHATFDRQAGMMGGTAAYADRADVGYGRADAGQRPITIDDIVTKTAVTAGSAIIAGGLTAWSGIDPVTVESVEAIAKANLSRGGETQRGVVDLHGSRAGRERAAARRFLAGV